MAKRRETAPVSVFDQHQLAIARATLKAPDAMVRVMGGPSKAEARKIIERITGKPPRNPPTRAARAFVGKKIRKLAREGVPARRRVGEALAITRRRGFRSIPKRPRGNPTLSEKAAWEHVITVTGHLEQRLRGQDLLFVKDVARTATIMLRQLDKGIHVNPHRKRNPVMGLIANDAPAVFTISKRVKEIVYIHSQDGEEYVHPFAPGVRATFLQDGRCVLWRQDGKPVGGRRIGSTIRPIGG